MNVPRARIVVYEAMNEAPETAKYVAGLFLGYDAHTRWVVSGPTAEAAQAKMETFWATEQRSYMPRTAPKKGAPSEAVDALEEGFEVL